MQVSFLERSNKHVIGFSEMRELLELASPAHRTVLRAAEAVSPRVR